MAHDRRGGLRSAFASLRPIEPSRTSTLKRLVGAALACGLLFGAAPAFAQAQCSRADLQAATDDYLAAQTSGEPSKMKFGLWVAYSEQMQTANMDTGVLSQPRKIDFHRSLFDTQSCSSFTEVVITDPAHPYVLGTLVQMRGGRVSGIEMLVTDRDDWLFNAANTLKYSRAENWSEIPPAERDSADTIMAAAAAYLDLFSDKSVAVPWGSPCQRLEGGLYTGKGAPGVSLPDDSCNVGVPDGPKLINRRYFVDEALGAVTVLLNFGDNQLPDAHTFRVEKGKIRYVHTITVCKTFNCGFKVPEGL
jgi:hypothetical protein